MKKVIIVIFLLFISPAFAKTISGEVTKETRSDINRIFDNQTNAPIEGAIVKLPAKNYTAITGKDGSFHLGTRINAPTIMSIQKEGYKPHSLTLSANQSSPIAVGIEKTTPNDIVIETDMIHLGDNSYSVNSAHAYDFNIQAIGAFYSKEFKIKPLREDENLFLSIGSIIGIDTMQAQRMGQSNVTTAHSSPPEIFCNGNKIAEIKINGDNQKINIPNAIIRGSEILNITIKTGRNLYKTTAIDFDDIEFTNLLLEIK